MSDPAAPVAVHRRSARVLCTDPGGAVLMEQVVDPAVPDVARYVCVGGGLDAGEALDVAASREAWEELGLTVDDLGEPVHRSVSEFGFSGRRFISDDTYFAVRVPRFDPAPQALTEYEVQAHRSWQWLSADELDALVARGAAVVPEGAGDLLRRVHAGLPAQPRRPTARVLVVDESDRVLLMRASSPAGTFWFPPGGGVDVGESPPAAARRELAEEIGVDLPSDELLGPQVWSRRHVLPESGLDLCEQWYLLRLDSGTLSFDRSGWTDLERATIDDMRWWSVAAIQRADDVRFSPRALGDLLPGLLTDERAGRLAGRVPVQVPQ